jgi:4-amino-4-deoxy-L-arabinose transferase-like glycosyltransferase
MRRLRRVPPAVWAVTVLLGALGVLHAVLNPLGGTPDEHTHADLIFHLAEGHPYPAHDARITSQAAWDALFLLHQSDALPNTPEKRAAVDLQLGWTFREWGSEDPGTNATFNQMAQHPPLAYAALAAVVRLDRELSGGPSPWFDEWHRLRLVSFAPLLALPVLSWSAARRLGAAPPAAETAAALPLVVPQLVHVTTGLTNDTLLAVLGAVLAWMLTGVLARGCRRSHAVAIGAVTGAALLTKAFAVVFPPWIAVVFLVRARRAPGEWPSLVRRLGLTAGVTAAVAGWWWVGNLFRYGTPTPTTESRLYTEALRPPGFEADPVWFLQRFVAWMPRRFVGWFGWLEIPLTPWVALAVAAGLGLGAAAAFVRPVPGVSRRALVAWGSVVPMLGLVVFARAYDLYTTTGSTPFIQGRYLFAGFVPIAVVAGVGLARLLGRWTPSVVVLAALAVQAETVRVVLAGSWGVPGQTSVARALEAVAAWAPAHAPLRPVLAAVAVASSVAVAATVRTAVGTEARAAPPPAGGGGHR